MTKQLRFEDYEVTECGAVYSPNCKLRPGLAGSGYYTVAIAGKSYLVHRLVAEKFLPNPEGKRTVNHKDGDKLNNHVDNLEWATDSENNQHSYRELGRKHSRPRLKLSDEEAQEVLILKGRISQIDLAEMYGVKRSLVADIHSGRRRILLGWEKAA